MLSRAYAVLHIKSVDAERRTFSGVATSAATDRVGDILEPTGAKFANPLSLLLFHDHASPVGTVRLSQATADGIRFDAHIPEITEPGRLKDRVDEAWQSVKAQIIRGVSVGFRVLDDGMELLRSGGVRFTKFEILELSLVSVPANSQAVIDTIKSLDAPHLAALGTGVAALPHSSGVTDACPVVKATRRGFMKTISEQVKEFEATRAAKSARMTELMTSAGEKGETLDETQSDEYDGIETELKSIDAHLRRLSVLEEHNKAAAKPVNGESAQKASDTRGGSVITVRDTLPPGIGFARSVMCQVQARLDNHNVLEVAKARYPHDTRLHNFLQIKAAVPAGTTTNDPWASPLVDTSNLPGEFIEFLRSKTLVDRFGRDGIPSLRRVPFNVRITGQTSGGVAQWTGQGRGKPVTSFAYNAVTMLYTKIAAIAVITEELARFSTPSAEGLVRDALAACVIERMDIDFIDPAQAAVSGVNPASITNGLTPLSSAGPTADNVRTDLINLLSTFVEQNQDPSGLVLIMPSTLGMALSIMTNSLGQSEFTDMSMSGGRLKGIPVLTSQYAANQSGAGNLVIAVNTNEVFLADDGQVRVDASREASIEMNDAPTGRSDTPTASSVVSMYQTNSIALRAERFVNWAKRRAEAVVYMDDVNWGSVGSP